jgi:CheY-like chemotaxis protein
MTLVLLVDDDPVMRVAVQNMLSVLGHEVVAAVDVGSALVLLSSGAHTFDQVVLDHDLPDGTGVEVAAVVQLLQPQARVVMHTSRALAYPPAGVHRVVRKAAGLDPLWAVLAAPAAA